MRYCCFQDNHFDCDIIKSTQITTRVRTYIFLANKKAVELTGCEWNLQDAKNYNENIIVIFLHVNIILYFEF